MTFPPPRLYHTGHSLRTQPLRGVLLPACGPSLAHEPLPLHGPLFRLHRWRRRVPQQQVQAHPDHRRGQVRGRLLFMFIKLYMHKSMHIIYVVYVV